MRTGLIFIVLLITSCGRDNNDCRSREHMVIRCQAETMPNYGYRTAVDVCNRSYEAERCY